MKNKFLFLFLGLCMACHRVPEDYKRVIEKAGSNRDELLKVIAHYDSLGQSEKKDAAYYLIGSMDNKYFYTGEIVTGFDTLFHYMDSMRRNGIPVTTNSTMLRKKWDELVERQGMPNTRFAEKYFDYEYYSACDIIDHINQAFEIRDSIPWTRLMSDQEFYEYILPHRIGTERPEAWNTVIYKQYQQYRDTTSARDRLTAAKELYRYLSREAGTCHVFNSYPFDIPYSLMVVGKRAVCKHLVQNMVMVMRANGLPVSIDYVPLWGSRNGGHFWGGLHLEDGSDIPFDVSGSKPFGEHEYSHYRYAKVYRKVFKTEYHAIQKYRYEDIPTTPVDDGRIDVTNIYTIVHDVEADLYPSLRNEKKRAAICTFDNKEWRVQAWGQVKNGKAYFENMGVDVVYMI